MMQNTSRFAQLYRQPALLKKWDVSASDFALFLSMLFVSIYLGSLAFNRIGKSFFGEESERPSEILVLQFTNFGMQIAMLLAFVVFARYSKSQTEKQNTLPFAASVSVGLKWLLLAYPTMIVASLLAQSLLGALGFERVIQEPIRLLLEADSRLELYLSIVGAVVLAPICEEVIFRGSLFRFLNQRVPLLASLLVSGVLFALPHSNLYNFTALVVIGVMLALAYRESGSLVSCITFHAVFNSINLALILLNPDIV